MNRLLPYLLTLHVLLSGFPAAAKELLSGQLSSSNGLSNSAVNYIFQDSEGYMWFSTWDGLNRYDGQNCTIYKTNPNDSSTLSNNFVKGVVEEQPGILWVTTDHGVNRFFVRENRFVRYFLGYEHYAPTTEGAYSLSIAGDIVFCSAYEWGLAWFDRETESFVPVVIPKYSLFDIRQIYADGRDHLWVLKISGQLIRITYRVTDGKVAVGTVEEIDCSGMRGSGIFRADDFRLFFVSKDNRLFTVDTSDSRMEPVPIRTYPASERDHIRHVLLYKDKLLVSSFLFGCDLYEYRNGELCHVSQLYNRNPTTASYVSDQDIVWIATDGQGVYKMYVNNIPFNVWYNAGYGPRINNANRAFYQDADSTLYVGTKGGGMFVIRHLHSKKPDVSHVDIGDNMVYSLGRGFGRELLAGTDAQGLCVYDLHTGKASALVPDNPLDGFSSVYAILTDKKRGVLWLATTGYGLVRLTVGYRNGEYRITHVRKYLRDKSAPGSINGNIVSSLAMDGDFLWVGTRGGGLCRLDIRSERFECFQSDPGDPRAINNNDIISLNIDPERNLWIGTGYGLNKLELDRPDKGFVSYTEKEGLPNNTIHGVVVDGAKLWLTTNGGVSMFDRGENRFYNFVTKDGLQSNEFSDGGYYKSPVTGEIFLGGINGFNYFLPEEINLRNYVPKIDIASFSIFGSERNIHSLTRQDSRGDLLRLSYNERFFSFRFVAIDYINGENCEYSYLLEGLSQNWTNNGSNPLISFTNVPPGRYTLKVRASNGDKIWSPETYELRIVVQAPWWGSWLAYIVYAMLAGALFVLVYLFFKSRWELSNARHLEEIEKQHMEALHQAKLRFFTNIAHEFNSSLTLIYGPCQKLIELSDNDYVKKYLNTIKINSDRMLRLIDQLMAFRKVETDHLKLSPEQVDVAELVRYLSDNFTAVLEEKEIRFSHSVPAGLQWITDRDALEKILFNILSNAVKYANEKGEVSVTVAQENDSLQIGIYNTGAGIPNEQVNEIFDRFKILDNFETQLSKGRFKRIGVGMALTKGLIDLLGGEIAVESREGEYTRFIILLPKLAGTESPAAIARGEEAETAFAAENPAHETAKGELQGDYTVMVVDDQEDIREFVRDILAPHYRVIEATDGLDALEILKYQRPDLIISDIIMPKLNGLGLLKELRGNDFTSLIPVIFLSSKSEVEDRISGFETGVDAYIAKPFTPRHLTSQVARILKTRVNLQKFYNSALSNVELHEGVYMDNADKEFISQATAIIESNIDNEELNPAFLCNEMAISRMQLYRKIRELTGTSPSGFIRDIRLKQAAKLLKKADMTVQEIMYAVGFNSKSYFYKEFTQMYGVSPKEYRAAK